MKSRSAGQIVIAAVCEDLDGKNASVIVTGGRAKSAEDGAPDSRLFGTDSTPDLRAAEDTGIGVVIAGRSIASMGGRLHMERQDSPVAFRFSLLLQLESESISGSAP